MNRFNVMEIRARLTDMSYGGNRIRLFGIQANGDEVFTAELKITKQITPVNYPAFAEIDKATAQVLMDDLWVCGLRPTEGSGSAGSLAATERHLADMRKIAFKKLDIDQKV